MCAAEASQKADDNSVDRGIRVEPFPQCLSRRGLRLARNEAKILQINVGLLCNQECRHCHLVAGPARKEMMDAKTMDDVVAFARRCDFETADITGGAPELNPHIVTLIEKLVPVVPRIMFRSNLTALNDKKREFLIDACKRQRVVIVASFPSLDSIQAEAQRGEGTFKASIGVMKKLNDVGYGKEGSGLELDLVSNPTGAFLPPSQGEAEKRFRQELKKRWGIVFNQLFIFANVPLGRFRSWLKRSGNFEKYMGRLASRFNPQAVDGLMCRTLVSVSWDGYLYDCDFNLADRLPLDGRKIHVSELTSAPEPGTAIAVSDHCYACTAGTGFT